MKELIRRIIFYCPFMPDEFVVSSESWQYRFLEWLYSNGEGPYLQR